MTEGRENGALSLNAKYRTSQVRLQAVFASRPEQVPPPVYVFWLPAVSVPGTQWPTEQTT